MNSPASIDAMCQDLCAVFDEIGGRVGWRERIAAAAVVIERVMGVTPVVVPVSAAAYSRSAVFRLGGAMVPQHEGEIEHFREQVGPAMVLLGCDAAAPHAVLVIGQLVVEVAHSADWGDRGVLVRPFVRACSSRDARWSVEGLRYGVSVAYEQVNDSAFRLPAGAAVVALADELLAALQEVERRAVGA